MGKNRKSGGGGAKSSGRGWKNKKNAGGRNKRPSTILHFRQRTFFLCKNKGKNVFWRKKWWGVGEGPVVSLTQSRFSVVAGSLRLSAIEQYVFVGS